MLKYEKPIINDEYYSERHVTLDGHEVATITTDRIMTGSMRFKGTLKVRAYNVYIYHINHHSTFKASDYDNARQALNACKRFIKIMFDHHKIS